MKFVVISLAIYIIIVLAIKTFKTYKKTLKKKIKHVDDNQLNVN